MNHSHVLVGASHQEGSGFKPAGLSVFGLHVAGHLLFLIIINGI